MHIIVCMKQVPDPEGPRECFEINCKDMRVEPRGIAPVLSLFDENALEAALKIKDADKDNVKITVLGVGKKVSNAVMLKALAAGADTLIKMEDPDFDAAVLDSRATAHVLAKAIEKLRPVDLVLVGRQAADWNAGYSGAALAGILGFPFITLAKKVEADNNVVKVERLLDDGYETVSAALPAVIMVSNEVGELRYPAMKDRRTAKKKPITTLTAADIGHEAAAKSRLKLKILYTPEMETGDCLMITADSLAGAGKKLVEQLKKDGVLQ